MLFRSGHYRRWIRSQRADADALLGAANAIPTPDYQLSRCQQAWRTRCPEELYPTTWVTQETIGLMRAFHEAGKPFFIQCSYPDPHHPFTPPGKYWDMYSPADFKMRLPYEAHKNPVPPMRIMREKFRDASQNTQTQEAFMIKAEHLQEAIALSCGMITMIDDAVGEIIKALKANGQYENTVIVFNADHGDYLGDYGLLLKGALQLNSITQDRKSTRLNSSHIPLSRMPSSA